MATIKEFMSEWMSNDPWIIAHTSGSTGTPKSIKLLKADMKVSAHATNQFFGITSESVLAIPLSMDYIAGKMMAVRAAEANCMLLELPVSNHLEIDKHIDLLSVVPSQLDSLLCDINASKLVSNLLIGGAPLCESLRDKVIAAGFNAYLGYGMTETCSHVAIRRLADNRPIYNAMPGISFDIDDRDCLVINSERFSWRTLNTNDIVELKSSTQFEWKGRADNVINSGGVKIHPELIEDEIRRQLPDIPPFYLVAKPDAKWGQKVVIVYEGETEVANELLTKISTLSLMKYSYPKEAIAVSTLPQTTSGKLKRILPI